MKKIIRPSIFLWLKRLCLGLLALLMLLTLLGAGFEAISRYRAAKKYPPRGKLVDIGGRKIHLDCRGSGAPTVVFEAGYDNLGSLSWTKVHDAIARTTRACAYDRAGIMWSDAGKTPQDGIAIADDLHAALTAAGEKPPYILVAHSLGGPLSMVHVGRYPDQIAGLVLVDPGHPGQIGQMASFPAIQELIDATDVMIKISAILSWTGIVRMVMPDEGQPGSPPTVTEQSNAYYSTSLSGMRATRASLERIMAQAAASHAFGKRPLIVLSAKDFLTKETIAALGMSKAEGIRFNADWRKFHVEEASWSTRSEHRIVSHTGHYIQFDQPDVVIAAVRDVVGAVRAGHQPADVVGSH